MEKRLLEALEDHFKVYEESKEFETWTERGYNIILSVEGWTEDEVVSAIEDFDPCHEVEIWWGNEEFRDNYNHSMAEAQEDMEEWKRDTLRGIKEALHPVEMQSASVYLTVRVDIRFPKSMDKEEAIETACENFDYDFKLEEDWNIEVEGMEICGSELSE